MKLDDLRKLQISVKLHSPIHTSHIEEELKEKYGSDGEFTKAEVMEVCRQYVYDNPEILDEFDISIKYPNEMS